MALTRAPQGGGDGLDFDDVKEALLALAKAQAKVVFRVRELHEPVQMSQEVHPVTADMIVCTGPSKGKALMGFRHIGKGITGPLRRAKAQGHDEVAARLELKTHPNKWVAAQTPNDDDFGLIEAFYGDGKAVWDKADPLVASAEPEAASGGLARVGGGDDSSELPPF